MHCDELKGVNSACGDAMAIFINYRREDSEGYARSIRDRLTKETDEANVFLDFDEIPVGENWRLWIDKVLSKAQAVIVIIGPRWLDVLKARAGSGHPDIVCREIAAGLDKPGVKVIPVTVGGGRIPEADALPGSIRSLADLNAIDLRGPTWNSDVNRLVEVLRRAGALPNSRRRWPAYAVAAGVALLLGAGAAVWALRVEVPSLPEDMSYKYAKALIEGRGLRFKPSGAGSDGGIDAVAAQYPEAGSSLFRGQSVQVKLDTLETYVLVCRGGGSFEGLPGEDGFTLEHHDSPASQQMKEGTCAWLDRPLKSDEASFIKPLGFDEQVPDMFRRAPLQLLAFCAKSQYVGRKSPRLVALSVTNYMKNDGGGRLTVAIGDDTCVDHAK